MCQSENNNIHARFTNKCKLTLVNKQTYLPDIGCQSSGGPNPPLFKTFAPRFHKHFLHDFTIFSTILQFAPRFYNLLHDFTICSTILQFAPRFYNLLHSLAICSTILQFAPRFYNLVHSFKICSILLQFALLFCNFLLSYNLLCQIVEEIVKEWRKL